MPNTFSTSINVLGPHRVTLHGTAEGLGGIASVEIISGNDDVGSATVNPDGSWIFDDHLDGLQVPVALVTDGKGVQTKIDPKLNLMPDSPQLSQFTSESISDNGGTIDVFGPRGRLLYDASVNEDTAVFLITGHGSQVPFSPFATAKSTIANFHPGGPAHDTLDLSITQIQDSADLLRHTSMFEGSATIHLDTFATLTLQGVTKAQIAHNPGDFTFAPPPELM